MNKKSIRLGDCQASFITKLDNDPYWNDLADDCDALFRHIVDTIVPEDGICVDGGANIGVRTLAMARKAKNGRVLAIEAGPMAYQALRENMAANNMGNVAFENIVLGDRQESVFFWEFSAFGSLKPYGMPATMTTLEAVIEQFSPGRADFIKLSLMGSEIPALRKSLHYLTRLNPTIYMEFNSWCQIAQDVGDPKRLLRWLFVSFKHIYRVRRVTQDIVKIDRDAGPEAVLSVLYDIMLNCSLYDDFLVTNNEAVSHAIDAIIE